ncbi:hypothetical protein HR060_05550 [Catenovulum sp. SM1970]|uniref:hypothetical protein n=1 Tax=Marinifaba aquimaris TaxID=2741323 RepID=UPI001571C966|nr:hypothetical protein [Marinifaba aquimaris]NTS76328.1 hypothetical protein [Marinifaba aquimaris]
MKNLLLICSLVLTSFVSLAGQYQASFARLDITPQPQKDSLLRLAGEPTKDYQITDPLFAKILLISDSQQKIGILSLDILGLLPAENEQLMTQLNAGTELDLLIVNTTHTHSGFVDDHHITKLTPQLIKLINQANSQFQPVQLAAYSIQVDESYNRIQKTENGIKMLWSNPKRIQSPAANTDLNMIDIQHLSGQPFLSIVNYNAHPVVTMDRHQAVVSADYPAYLAKRLKQELKREMMFLAGAAGDTNPYDAGTTPVTAAVEKAKDLAAQLFTPIKQALVKPKTYQQSGHIDFVQHSYQLPLEASGPTRTFLLDNGFAKPINAAQVNAIRLSKDIALATFSGEFFSDFANQLKNKSEYSHTLFVGYSNGSLGYVPTIEASKLGGYGAGADSIMVKPGIGEKMVSDAADSLNQIRLKF